MRKQFSKKVVFLSILLCLMMLSFRTVNIGAPAVKANTGGMTILYDETQGVNSSAWTQYGSVYLTDDNSIYYDGYSSLSFVSATFAQVVNAYTFVSEFTFSDASDFNLSFWVTGFPDNGNCNLAIWISDGYGNSYYATIAISSGWQFIQLSKADFSIGSGSPIWDYCSQIQFSFSDFTDYANVQCWVDNCDLFVNSPPASNVYADIQSPANVSSGHTDLFGIYAYNIGDYVTVNAYQSSGWIFSDWKIQDALTGTQYIYTNPLDIQIPDNMIVIPEFTMIPIINQTFGILGNNAYGSPFYSMASNPYLGDNMLWGTMFHFTGGYDLTATNISFYCYQGNTRFINVSCALYLVTSGENGTNANLTLVAETPYYYFQGGNVGFFDFITLPLTVSHNPLQGLAGSYAVISVTPSMNNSNVLLVNGSYYVICIIGDDDNHGFYVYCSNDIYHSFNVAYDINSPLPSIMTVNMSTNDVGLLIYCGYSSPQTVITPSTNLPLDLIVFLLILLIPTYVFYNYIGSIAVPPSLMLMTAICWMGGIVPISVLLIVVIVSVAIMFRNPIRGVVGRVRGDG